MFVTSQLGAYFPKKQINVKIHCGKFPLNMWAPVFIVPFPNPTAGQAQIINNRPLRGL